MQISITKLMPVIITLIAIAMPLQAQAFTDINAGLENVMYSSVAWGDYDNDGDLDILLTGYTGYVKTSRIYRNDSGTFTDIFTGLEGVWESSAAWGDYDNDGDLDILMTGNSYYGFISRIYPNEGIDWDPPFEYHIISLEGVHYSSVDWGDYDNDGDLDILLTGSTNSGMISRIYKNEGGTFTNYIPLEGVSTSSASWGDYDNDGDLDILLTGFSSGVYISRIYRNDSGTFTDIVAGLEGVWASSVAWGDYDNDGDLDILLTGQTASSQNISRIYRNNSGTFTDINSGLEGVFGSSVAWGDYDNDGDLDILLTGGSQISGHISRIYRNDSGTFTDINAGLEGVRFSSAAWGDYDNDGDLDILLTGMNDTKGNPVSRIYRNNCLTANSVPAVPTNLSAVINGSDVTFSWDKATDTQTPQNGLSYNLYLGTATDTGNKKSPMSNITNGYRKVVALGNTNQKNSWTIKGLTDGFYYWSVQAIDHAFAGSDFSAEKSFFKGSLGIPQNVAISNAGVNANLSWNAVQYADSYKIYASTNPYGTYSDVSESGTFAGTTWSQAISGNKLFYYVVAVSGSKEIKIDNVISR